MGKKIKSCYSVIKGFIPGIQIDWNDCKTQIDKFPGQQQKGFQSIDDAIVYSKDYFNFNENMKEHITKEIILKRKYLFKSTKSFDNENSEFNVYSIIPNISINKLNTINDSNCNQIDLKKVVNESINNENTFQSDTQKSLSKNEQFRFIQDIDSEEILLFHEKGEKVLKITKGKIDDGYENAIEILGMEKLCITTNNVSWIFFNLIESKYEYGIQENTEENCINKITKLINQSIENFRNNLIIGIEQNVFELIIDKIDIDHKISQINSKDQIQILNEKIYNYPYQIEFHSITYSDNNDQIFDELFTIRNNKKFIRNQKELPISNKEDKLIKNLTQDDKIIKQTLNLSNKVIHIQTDGSCLNQQDTQHRKGAWGQQVSNYKELGIDIMKSFQSEKIVEQNQTNNIGELLAILYCLDKYKSQTSYSLNIQTDSSYAILMIEKIKRNENIDGYKNIDILYRIKNIIDEFLSEIQFHKVKAHSNDKNNNIADQLANSTANGTFSLTKIQQMIEN